MGQNKTEHYHHKTSSSGRTNKRSRRLKESFYFFFNRFFSTWKVKFVLISLIKHFCVTFCVLLKVLLNEQQSPRVKWFIYWAHYLSLSARLTVSLPVWLNQKSAEDRIQEKEFSLTINNNAQQLKVKRAHFRKSAQIVIKEISPKTAKKV